MNIFSAMSSLNLMLAIILFFVALGKLKTVESKSTEQLVVTPLILAIAMAVMHSISVNDSQHGVGDVVQMAWRLLDFLTMLALIRLIRIV